MSSSTEGRHISLPEPLRQRLITTVRESHGVLPGSVAARTMAELGLTGVPSLMMRLLPVAAAYARVPVSNYPVGAAALGMPNGHPVPDIYLGANVEFTGEALSVTVHAEQSAVTNAWLHGQRGIQALAISAAPCGYCRQFLYELATARTLSIFLPPEPRPAPLTAFLPDAFGPQNLGVPAGLMASQNNGLYLDSADSVVQAALTAANASYAPYTRNWAGVALVTPRHASVTGRYAESAAYNPSLSPLQSAIASLNMTLAPQEPLTITRAVLVESAAKASQRSATAALLAAFAPSVELEYHAVQGQPTRKP